MSWLHLVAAAAAGIATLRAAFERGDVGEAARQGALAGPAIVERALISGDRMTRLAGIAAAPGVEDRAELLAPLADLAAGADRRTAIPAAEAARAIARELAAHPRPDDLAAGDLAAWQTAWAQLALRGDRWIELRIAALDTAAALDLASTGTPTTGTAGIALDAGFGDPDPAFRRAVAAAIRIPVAPPAIAALAGAVRRDIDPVTALTAAQSLCLSLEAGAAPDAVLNALGAAGLARIRALIAGRPRGATASALRDAARCLAPGRRPAP